MHNTNTCRIFVKVMKKIFHLYKKHTNSNEYYGSLKAVFDENKDLRVSKYKLDRWNFSNPFENEACILTSLFLLIIFNIINK